jgi:hypothetical protein
VRYSVHLPSSERFIRFRVFPILFIRKVRFVNDLFFLANALPFDGLEIRIYRIRGKTSAYSIPLLQDTNDFLDLHHANHSRE